MLSTNTNFDTKHALASKVPMYSIYFEDEAVMFVNHRASGYDTSQLAPTSNCTDPDDDQDVTTGWSSSNSTITSEAGGITGNCLKVVATAGNGQAHKGGLSITEGVLTRLKVRAKAAGGDEYRVFLYSAAYGGFMYDSGEVAGDGSTFDSIDTVVECPSTQSDWQLALRAVNDTDNAYFDNVSLKAITQKQYLKSISGLPQKVSPEEGKSSIGGVKVEILDYNDEVTALLATDSYYFHRKKTTIKAGYTGLAESEMLPIVVGWVTGLSMSSDGLSYIFNITDPQKWMQRKIFRGAEDTSVVVSGNPINILLALLTSTGAGTNGDYDYYAAVNSLGIDDDYIDVAGIEAVRDDWFPGDSHYMKITISERIRAKDFFGTEIFKPLNIYPKVTGDGKFGIRPFKPPMAALDEVQSFTKDNIIGMPGWNSNLPAMINELEISYNHDGSDFVDTDFYIDSTSVDNRGPGKKPLVIKSKGLHTSLSPSSHPDRATQIIIDRKNSLFGRFATPPIKVTASTWFDRWISEAGDIVPITHANLPDIEAGTRGLTASRMEIVNRGVDWKRGMAKFEFLNTGFDKSIYGVVSPTMTITGVTDQENFAVSAADAAKYANLTSPEVQICDAGMRQKVANVTILSINTTTGVIVIDSAGTTLYTGWIVLFAVYDNCTTEQKNWAFIADASNDLGTANDDAQLVAP